MWIRFFLVVAAASAMGCAAATKQTDKVLTQPENFAPQAQVEGVPFIEQATGHCGPATLTMVMNWAGSPVTVNEITDQVYTPKSQGSLQNDLISAARRHGFMALPIEGLPALLHEVAANHPVLVLENLALSWLPQWHYAVVYGYDLRKLEVVMHSGPEKAKRWDMRKFERSWQLADSWGLVILPAGQLSATADELTHVTAAAGIENIGRAREAGLAYASILQRWPKSLGALVGLANVRYAEKNFREALRLLREATQHHPTSQIARHNLEVARQAVAATAR